MNHGRLYSVALTVDCMKRAVELPEVAELAGLSLLVGCGKVSADVRTRGSGVACVDERVACLVYHITGNASFAVIA